MEILRLDIRILNDLNMTDNDIYTFELDYFHTKMGLSRRKLGETHKLLKNPSFNELNKLITEYPESLNVSNQNSRPNSQRPRRAASTSRGSYERSPYTEEEHFKECTFKPQIREIPGKENKKIPLAQKIANLSKSKKDLIEEREKTKRNQELQQAITYNYTPSINSYTSKPSIPLEDRFKHERIRIEEREKLKRAFEVEKESECTFKPQITKRKLVSQLPLFQRVEEVQVDKLKKYTKLRQKYELEHSFKPSINENSRNLSSQRKMSTETRTSTSHRCLSRTSLTQENSTFRLPTRENYLPNEFLNRQAQFSEKLAEKLREKTEEKLRNYNFTPSINKTSSIIVETCTSPMTLMQKSRKLSDGNVEKVKKQEVIRENFYAQFRHSPEINENSRKIGRSSSISKLTENHSKDKLRQKRAEELFNEDVKNCTFSPGINQSKQFSYIQSGYKQNAEIMKNIEKNLTDRTQKSKEIKYTYDYNELKNCSFKPEIKKTINRTGSLNTVKGLERYFELKEISKRLAKEKYERELKVFSQRPTSTYTSRS